MSRRIAKFNKKKFDNGSNETPKYNLNLNLGGKDATKQIAFQTDFGMQADEILSIFQETFRETLQSPHLQELVQEVKEDLYNRDYLAAFDSDEKRSSYACRWSPARALSYSSLFALLKDIRELLLDEKRETQVLCVGGGASSEVVALASLFCRMKEQCSTSASSLNITVVDIANWSDVINRLVSTIKARWIRRQESLRTSFLHHDILTMDQGKINYASFDLITLLFTTNELFCEKRGETVKFLQMLNSVCKTGSCLLIVESAGSYSNVAIGSKIFPVQFLIDTILCGKKGDQTGPWYIIEETDSCWYRIDQRSIDFGMKLENMRFFYRLYKKR